jgi:WD40 repeat protein
VSQQRALERLPLYQAGSRLQKHKKKINAIRVAEDEFFTVDDDGVLVVWNKVTLRKIRLLKGTATNQGHEDSINGVYVDTNHIYTCSNDKTILTWNRRVCVSYSIHLAIIIISNSATTISLKKLFFGSIFIVI